MKAVILAGGEGMRLRPLTCTMPKPLLPLCGRPCAEYILDLLCRHGYDEAVFTLSYRAEMIENHFSTGEYNGITLGFSRESEPLGTAGSVRAAIGEKPDDCDELLVISGDALCDFDLTSARLFHRKNGADVTVIAKSVDDPREYGVILAGEDGVINGFCEKPSFEGCISELANTGVYILSAGALELIERDKASDFAKDIFPMLLSRGMKLMCFTEAGYWCDIGNLKDYIRCQRAMLEGSVGCEIHAHRDLNGIYSAGDSRLQRADVSFPAYIGKNVTIGDNARISEGSVIGDNVRIGRNAKIKGSVILSGAYIGDRATCCEAVIGEGARVLEGAAVYEYSAVGAKAVIGRGAVVESGVRVWTNKAVAPGMCAGYDIKHGTSQPLLFGDDGISGETGGEIMPHNAAKIGMAVSALSKRIAVGFSAGEASEVYALALASGIAAGGADVLLLGTCPETAVDFAVVRAGAGCGVYVDSRTGTKFRFISGEGLNLTREEERRIENALRDGCACSGFGKILDFTAVSRQYEYECCMSMPRSGLMISPQLSMAGSPLTSIIDSVAKIEASGDSVIFSISSDCRRLSAYSEGTGFVSYDRLIMLCCLKTIAEGGSVVLPESFPEAADSFCRSKGSRVTRYTQHPATTSQHEARKAAASCAFVRDGILALATVLSYLADNRLTMRSALGQLPEFATITRSVSISCPPGKAMKTACGSSGGKIRTDKGTVTLKPSRTGRSIYILAEAYSTETAAELCGIYERKIGQLGDNT